MFFISMCVKRWRTWDLNRVRAYARIYIGDKPKDKPNEFGLTIHIMSLVGFESDNLIKFNIINK